MNTIFLFSVDLFIDSLEAVVTTKDPDPNPDIIT